VAVAALGVALGPVRRRSSTASVGAAALWLTRFEEELAWCAPRKRGSNPRLGWCSCVEALRDEVQEPRLLT
jgi:hypothetical protein